MIIFISLGIEGTAEKTGVGIVDSDGNPLPLENWNDCKMYVTKSGSTIAIRPDGDIISVCKNLAEIPSDNMKALLKFATEPDNGGTKLDSFDGNWGFYRACGFEPVSWNNSMKITVLKDLMVG